MSANKSKDPSPWLHEEPKRSSHWTEIEDRILKQGVARHGVNHWDEVAKMIWTRRSAEECRARWAELVPLLHDSLARRESRSEQQERRKRSVTTSASVSVLKTSQHQEAAHFEPLSTSVLKLKQQRQESREEFTEITAQVESGTEPSTSTTEVPSTTITSLSSVGSAQAAGPVSRSRRHTEPGVPSYQTAAGPSRGREQHEWLAPHPLMPGRSRNPSVSSRNTPATRNRDASAKITPEEKQSW
ncbi:hypothetical protein F5Y06DRAFT_295940 [Hypoxylon sp. FL0890]|nr:hypothetical protein F5Y06DRAFT_295940 [Hypoxylon sp. FL0890]